MTEHEHCPACGGERYTDEYGLCLTCTPNKKIARKNGDGLRDMDDWRAYDPRGH